MIKPKRIISSLLACVMMLGMIPTQAFTAMAAGTVYLEDRLKQTSTLNITLDNTSTGEDAADRLYSEKTKYSSTSKGTGLGTFVGQYLAASNGGAEGYAYCADHTKSATNKMQITVTSANKKNDPMLNLVFFLGASGDERGTNYALTALKAQTQKACKAANIAEPSYVKADWTGLTQAEWRKATQIALWMALPVTVNGKAGRMLYVQNSAKIVKSGSGFALQGLWDGSAFYDTLTITNADGSPYQVKGRTASGNIITTTNDSTPSKVRVLNVARSLYLYASFLNAIGWNIADRQATTVNYPLEKDNEEFVDFYNNNVIDFSSAAEDNTGTIDDAYKKIVNNLGTEQTIYDDGTNYVMYFMFASSVQVNGGTNVTIDTANSTNMLFVKVPFSTLA